MRAGKYLAASRWAAGRWACVPLLASLAACAQGPVAQPGLAVSAPAVAQGQAGFANFLGTTYVLRASDKISVNVFREEELSMPSVTVAADGMISLPLLGSMHVAGMTIAQVEDQVELLLGGRYLRNPAVAVNVVEYSSHTVTVEGAVETPGVFSFLPGSRLSAAIASAEGLRREAEPQEVAVFRQTPQGIQIAKFDYQAVQTGMMLDPILEPGDRVVVGTDGLSQFWQDLIKTLPAFALFTNVNF